jgi:hypothetical protein
VFIVPILVPCQNLAPLIAIEEATVPKLCLSSANDGAIPAPMLEIFGAIFRRFPTILVFACEDSQEAVF